MPSPALWFVCSRRVYAKRYLTSGSSRTQTKRGRRFCHTHVTYTRCDTWPMRAVAHTRSLVSYARRNGCGVVTSPSPARRPSGGTSAHAHRPPAPRSSPRPSPRASTHHTRFGRGGRASSAEGSCPQSSLPTNSHPSDTSGPTARRPTGPPSSPASLRGGVGPQTRNAHAALPTTPVHTPQTIRMEGRPPRRAGARSPSSSPKQGEWVTAPTVPCVGHGFDGVGA